MLPQPTPLIRSFQPGDESHWLRLRDALWPDEDVVEARQEMREMLANPDFETAFFAVPAAGAPPVGFVEVSIHEQVEWCETPHVGYIEGWFVDPLWRRRGIGGALIAAAEDWARTRGCREMASDTNEDYPLSPAAHHGVGFGEAPGREMVFRKWLI